MFFLAIAPLTFRAIRPIRHGLVKEALCAFAYPPFPQAPEKNFRRADPADTIPWRVYGNVGTRSDGMDINEET